MLKTGRALVLSRRNAASTVAQASVRRTVPGPRPPNRPLSFRAFTSGSGEGTTTRVSRSISTSSSCTSVALAGCVLAGLWTATCFVYGRTSTVYLDSDTPTPQDSRAHKRPSIITEDSSSFDKDLRKNERTSLFPPDSGITRCDSVRLASNEPVEDKHAQALLPVPSGYWSLFGVFDGHSGNDTSIWLADNLIPAVTGALADLYSRVSGHSESPVEPTPSDIERTLKDTFKRLDDDIVLSPLDTVFSSDSKHAAVTLLAPAYSGSCAILSFYDSHSGLLHTALTGDSRAVLGRRAYDDSGKPTGTYYVHEATADQNGWNPTERERLESEHPGEDLVRNGRVLGMGMSRAFGDARYKWSREVQDRLKRKYLGRTPLPHVKTPPYLTAEPEVTSIAVRPGDFLIIASDGLWESLTNEEAVGLVGLWKDARSTRSPGPYTSETTLGVAEIPLERQAAGEHDGTVRYRQWGAEKRFVSVDENVATHLLRNALGGADVDLTAALLSMRAPQSRIYRDDITVVVVFFAEDDRRKPA